MTALIVVACIFGYMLVGALVARSRRDRILADVREKFPSKEDQVTHAVAQVFGFILLWPLAVVGKLLVQIALGGKR